jgi:hypothetical protein
MALMFALAILVSGPLSVAAQEGTPTIDLEGGSGPKTGEAVSWIGNEGSEVAKVTINSITDPFTDYDPASGGPQRGFHFVALSVTVENTGSRLLSVDPSAFEVVDEEGYLSRYYSVYRTQESTDAMPDLQYGDVGPGDTVTGQISYQLLNGTSVDSVVLAPDSTRLITLAASSAEVGNGGDPVSVIGVDGNEAAQITVNQVLDPFDDYDPNSAPPRGQHYIAIEVTVKNTSAQTIVVDPSYFYPVDADGFVGTRGYVYPVQGSTFVDLQYAELPAGQTVSGMIYFSALDGAITTNVVYMTYYYNPQLITLAVAGPDGFASNPATPAVTSTSTAVASSADCEGVTEWVTFLVGQVQAIFPTITDANTWADPATTNLDAETIRAGADAFDDASKAFRGADVPAIAEDLNNAIRLNLGDASDALNDLADAVEGGDATEIADAQSDLAAALEYFNETGGEADTAITAVTTACPEAAGALGG